MKWPSWPPRPWRSTSIAGSARCAPPPGSDPPPAMPPQAFGIYVHVPFCRERCDYCAFATYTDRDHLMERYADACVTEVQRLTEKGELVPAPSVFFGGGPPSRLRPETLWRILRAIPRTAGAEVTVECNPEDADQEH